MIVQFLEKEYSIPEDVLTYIDLLSFTDGVQKQLFGTFVRKLKNEIAKDNIGLLDDKDLAQEIEQQVGKYIAKLCDNDIFTRTINDYLKNNKGYQLISQVNKAALEKMKSLLIREMDEWQSGYENAVSNAESHVTGMGFSIWSSSFVNHAIYAAMEASKLKEQSKEAEAQYQKDMSDLRSRLDSHYGGEKSNYINNTYIPNMEAALTVFAYELLDKYVADNYDTVFTKENIEIYTVMFKIAAYLRYLKGDLETAQVLYSLDSNYSFLTNILRKSIYEYYVGQRYILKNQRKVVNKFEQKMMPKNDDFELLQLDMIVASIEAKWVDNA